MELGEGDPPTPLREPSRSPHGAPPPALETVPSRLSTSPNQLRDHHTICIVNPPSSMLTNQSAPLMKSGESPARLSTHTLSRSFPLGNEPVGGANLNGRRRGAAPW